VAIPNPSFDTRSDPERQVHLDRGSSQPWQRGSSGLTDDIDATSGGDRLDELALVLAAGYLRLLSGRRDPSLSNDQSVFPLDFTGNQSVCVEPIAKGETQ
jgi:hypothetical protein